MILELLGSGLVGSLVGLLGSALTSISGYYTQKLKNERDVKMAEISQENITIEANANIKVANAKTEGEIEVAEIDAYKQSYSFLNKDLFEKDYMKYLLEGGAWWNPKVWVGFILVFLFGVVDFLKHSARPVLTYYLVGATTWVTYMCWKIVGGVGMGFTAVQAADLFQLVVMTILYLTTSTVSWWFADRRVGKFLNDQIKRKDTNTVSNITSNWS